MKQKNKPQYLIIYEQLRHLIENGEYSYGQKMPSKRVIADRYGVSVVTSQHAYELLEEEGYLFAKERSGFFVCYQKDSQYAVSDYHITKRQPQFTETEISDFPFSTYAKTVRFVLSERGPDILQKSPGKGSMELREAIARYLSRSRGMHTRPEQIVIGSGAEYLYGLVLRTLQDCDFAIESPSYKKIEQVYRSAGVNFDRLRLESDGVNSMDLAATEAQVLHVTPYRSYPTGITATAAKKREYLRWAGSDKWIIEDDFESEFSLSAKPVDTLYSLGPGDNVIYINTFSKTIAPAIRIGYMVLPEKLLARFDEQVGFFSCSVPTFEQLVLAEFINSGNFERHINRIRRKRRKSME